MDEPGFTRTRISTCRVAIWGLGLMGGSLALALKEKCSALVGIDVDEKSVEFAVNRGIVQDGSTNPKDLLAGSDVIVLATPVRTIQALLETLPDLLQQGAVVMDLGSTKREILQKMGELPERFDPVGGHPMCGKEKGTIINADAAIFKGATFALVEHPRSSSRAKALAEEIAIAAGSRPLWLDADAHDRAVAASSHVPFLLANALAKATPESAAPLIGSGFRSTTRVAGTPANMMIDVLQTNADHIQEALDNVRQILDRYEELIREKKFQILAQELEQGAEQYRSFVKEG
jgi:prephenate dehydrogenase